MIAPSRPLTGEDYDEWRQGLYDWLEARNMTLEEYEAQCKAAEQDFS